MELEYYSSIQLFTEDETISSENYCNDVGNVESAGFSYTKYKVTKEAGDGAVWLVYSEPNYGGAGSGVGNSEFAYPEKVGMLRPGFAIKSIQAFNVTQPCICLFEHSQYRDNKLPTEQSVNDIRKSFPPGEVARMSSAIACSGLWSLYTKPAFNGPNQDVDALGGNQAVPLFKLNDLVQSVKLVRASPVGVKVEMNPAAEWTCRNFFFYYS